MVDEKFMKSYCHKIDHIVLNLLKLSILSTTISSCIALITSDFNEISFTVSYFSIISSFYIIICSVVVLVVTVVYNKIKKIKIWASVKKKFLILILAIVSLAILAFINYFKFN